MPPCEYRPAGHSVPVLTVLSVQYRPGGQRVQAVEPAAAKWPDGHGTGPFIVPLQYVPAGHCTRPHEGAGGGGGGGGIGAE
jgi:hypothetical protein